MGTDQSIQSEMTVEEKHPRTATQENTACHVHV